MSPDRLRRHHNPPDHAVVRWGEVREVGNAYADKQRHTFWNIYGAIAILLALVVGLAVVGGVIIRSQGREADLTRAAAAQARATAVRLERATCSIRDYADDQAVAIRERDGLDSKPASELDDLARKMESTGITCPPRDRPRAGPGR